MKNHQKTNSTQKDIALANIHDPELRHIIADVMIYNETYDIPMDHTSYEL